MAHARIVHRKQRLLLFVTKDAHGFENPEGRVAQMFVKILGGLRLSRKIDRGCPPILGFINKSMKFAWGVLCLPPSLTPPPSPPPVCIYVFNICLLFVFWASQKSYLKCELKKMWVHFPSFCIIRFSPTLSIAFETERRRVGVKNFKAKIAKAKT